jgi:hypothetical protein
VLLAPLINNGNEKGAPLTLLIKVNEEKPDVPKIRFVCNALARYATVVIIVSETNAAIEFALFIKILMRKYFGLTV